MERTGTTNRDDDIKIIVSNFIQLQPVMTHICKFCISALLFYFFFLVDVTNVPGYYRLIALEKISHLLLSQPYSVFSHSDLQPDSLIRLIHDDFAFV